MESLVSQQVTLTDITVRFGSSLALEVPQLELSSGASVALMGSNGSGKTTMLRVIGGLLEPTKGRRDVSPDFDVAYVAQHQHHHQWMPLTAGEVLAMGRYRKRGLLGRFTQDDRTALDAAADRLDVSDLRDEQFGELSGGQRQRVLVASALASDAGCLLLDEPITGLDLPSQNAILRVIDEETERDRIVVLSTHHLSEARRCDRVVLLDGGVVADGTPDDVLTEVHLAAAFGVRLLGSNDEMAGPVIVVDEHGHDHTHHHDRQG